MYVGGFLTEYTMRVFKCKLLTMFKVAFVKINAFQDACFKMCRLYFVDLVENYSICLWT